MVNLEYEDKNDVLNFEKVFCNNFTKTWLNKAWDLRNSSEVLYQVQLTQTEAIFDNNKEAILKDIPLHHSTNIQRLLWGYSFENLIKVLIILKLKNNDNIVEVPIEEIKSHDLQQLAKKANIQLSDDESFYLGILTKATVWAGRYPMSFNQHYIPKSRASMSTREELKERSKQQFDKLLKGKIKRIEEESDILNTGITSDEIELYKILFDKLLKKYNKYEETNNLP